jgi:hypothetical protein
MESNELFTEQEEEQYTLPANTLISLADEVEQRLDAMNKIKRVALKLTNKHDWIAQNGKPYLQASGAEKIARLFGVSWRISEPVQEDLAGGHFSFTYKGEFSLQGATIEAIGTRNSKDGFFSRGGKLPASEIDRGDVKKAAYTNLLANGITRILGVRNLTYDDLEEYAGISQNQVTSISYSKPPMQTSSGTNPSPPSEAQIKGIYTRLAKLGIEGDELRHATVSEIAGTEEQITSMAQLSKSQASAVIERLEQELRSKGNDN